MRNLLAGLAALTASTGAMAGETDPVVGMCTPRDTDATCICAAAALRDKLSAGDYALYERVGAAYLEHLDGGMAAGAAWDAAISDAGAALSLTNEIGRAHRAAIRKCRG